MRSRGSNDETAQSSQRSVGSTLPFLSLPGAHPAQPPTAKVKEATNLNASLLHMPEPSTLPAHSPREGGRTEQRSHPRPLGFHIYTNALLGTAAQHPGTQETRSKRQIKVKGAPRLSPPPPPSSSEPWLSLAAGRG